jgi:hypothetical protein
MMQMGEWTLAIEIGAAWLFCGFVTAGVRIWTWWLSGADILFEDIWWGIFCTLLGPIALLYGVAGLVEMNSHRVLIKGRRSALNQTKQGQ